MWSLSLVGASLSVVALSVVGRGGRKGRAYSPREAVVELENTGEVCESGLDVSGSSGVVGPTANCHAFLE